jgi:hypothetical protein
MRSAPRKKGQQTEGSVKLSFVIQCSFARARRHASSAFKPFRPIKTSCANDIASDIERGEFESSRQDWALALRGPSTSIATKQESLKNFSVM